MADDIITLKPRDDSPVACRSLGSEEAARLFREYAERAERGEIVSAVIAFVRADGRPAHNWTPTDDTSRMVSAITLAQAAYVAHVLVNCAGSDEDDIG